MTQRQVDLQNLLELEQERHYQDLQQVVELKKNNNDYSKSVNRDDEIVRKRAKPGYLLKR